MPRGAFATICALLALAPCAVASPAQEAGFMDDPLLVYGTDEQVEATMGVLRSLGADRVRVSVFWRLVAPAPDSSTRPAFDATNPAVYPAGAWDRYDRVVLAARRHGLAVQLTLTGPGPQWASADAFRELVTAVGRRYSGSWVDERPAPPPDPGGLPIPLPGQPPPPPPDPGEPLPRVDVWSVWNEPNQYGWLRPQWRDRRPASPALYRALVDAAWAGLGASGHGGDTILLGETAPRGSVRRLGASPMKPLVFIRELYCVDRRLRPLRRRGCPGSRKRFAAEHPALFAASGWAHHPYALEAPPGRRDRVRDQVTLASLGRLTRTLDRLTRRRLPIWLTEYGYQTNPPDTLIGVSWRRQAAWLNEAEHIAYRNPRVASLTQFLLVDDGPHTAVPPSSPRYWGHTFQSGLVARDGTRKPAFAAWQRPIHVTGRRVWGALRPAPPGAELTAAIEFRRGGSRTWRVLRRVTTRTQRNYVVAHVRRPGRGQLRLNWGAGGVSRAVTLR